MIVRRPLAAGALDLSAQQFRDRYAPGVRGSVDLESIIELEMQLEIRPEPLLVDRLGLYAYLTQDGKTIVVDELAQLKWPEEEYQALLAHEAGHAHLHAALLPPHRLATREEFVAFHHRLPELVRLQLEWEARYWSRAIRMPDAELREVLADVIEEARDQFPEITSGGAKIYVEFMVAEYFGVSPEHAEARLRDIQFWTPIRRAERDAAALRRALKPLEMRAKA